MSVILSASALTIMAGSIIAPGLHVMRDSLGVAPSTIGLIITTHGLFMALFSPLMGSLIDRKGVKWPFIFALIGCCLAGGSGLLLVSRACPGIALAGVFTGINVLILNMYERRRRDRVMGWRESAQSFGGAVWPLVGGTLVDFSRHFLTDHVCSDFDHCGYQGRLSARRRNRSLLVLPSLLRLRTNQ